MIITDARKQCTDIRMALFDNGYTPLPNKNKMCLLPDWNKVEVTPEMIQSREWTRSNQRRDTGLRCGDIIAIDWDINDEALMRKVMDGIIEAGIIERSDFIRIGKAPREMWIFRTHDKIGKRTTGFFAPSGADDSFKPHQVELLGRGCQIAAYGMRDAETWYTWPKKSLVDHKYMELPEITLAQVEAVKDKAIEIFKATGLVRKSAEGGTDEGYTHVFDLTPDMVFEVKDMGTMTIAEIEEFLRNSPPETTLRCRVDTLRPGTSGSWAGMVSLNLDGALCLSDHGSYSSHFLKENDQDDQTHIMGKLLQERFGNTPAPLFVRHQPEASTEALKSDPLSGLEMDPTKPMDDNFQIALRRFAYVQDHDTVADALLNKPDISIAHFKNATAQYYRAEVGNRGGQTIIPMHDIWMRSPERTNVRGFAMRPDQPYPFFTEDGDDYFNTYRPQVLADDGDPSMGFELLTRLLPIESERRYFTQWLAYKLLHPEIRGPGVIMVAHDKYGTGRGTLIEIIKAMFAEHLTRIIDFDTLTGKGTQGQYNEWLVDALLVAVNEAQETNNTSKWQVRQNAYEHLKNIVDPGHHDVYVKRKGLGNYQGKTYASVLVMTNHMDSMVLPRNDRRFAILENGYIQSSDYWEQLHAWRKVPENIGAFVAELKKTDLSDYNPFIAPPMTHAKADMVDAGESALDKALDHVFAKLDGSLLTREQLLLALEDYVSDYSVEFPDEWRRSVDRIFARRTRTIPKGLDRVYIDGKYRFVRLMEQHEFVPYENVDTLLAEVLRNGPLTRTVQASSTVVNFPKR